jgi:hypothetical protein
VNDHGSIVIDPDDLHRTIQGLFMPRDAMTWSPRWQDRTGDAVPMRSHP